MTTKPLPERRHSRFAPSSLSRVLNCPPSVLLAEANPGVPVAQTSVWAAEGTVAHQLAEELLAGIMGLRLDDLVSVPPHVIPVDDEMYESAFMFSEYVNSLMTPTSTVWREQIVRLDKVVGKDARCYGHLDACVWDARTGILDLADFKYGQGIVVRVRDNPQLYAYALGALYTLVSTGERPRCTHIRLHVVQPRLGDRGTNSYVLARDELDQWGRDVLYPVIRALVDGTLDKDAPLTPGDHCRYCPVVQTCPALHKSAMAMAREAFAMHEISPTPQVLNINLQALDNATLGSVLDRAELILPWLDSLRELALTRMNAGETIPGWKLVAKRGHRVWIEDEPEVIKTLSRWGMLLENIWQPVKIKSAAQLEKLVPAAFREEFRKLWRMESSGVTLAPETDARPARLPAAASLSDE